MTFLFRHLGLTGRILISFWLTLVCMVLAMALLFFYQKDSHEHREMPPIKSADELAIKLITLPFNEASVWFAKQDKKDRRRIFVTYGESEILNRPLPKPLHEINKQLSAAHPFIHKRKLGYINVGRRLLLPNGHHVHVLIHTQDFRPPFRHIIRDNWLPILFIIIAISGVISFLLARFISRPIIALRQATQKFANGDLSIRIGNSLKKRQDESYLLAQDFDHMADRLEQTISSQKHLIQDISHELRSPVARLQLALELAQKKLNITDEQTDIQRIKHEIEQINSIINTLLNLPAYELEPQLVRQDTVDIVELVSNIIHDLNFSHNAHTIVLCNELDPNSTYILLGNRQLLTSALTNVFKNSQHYHEGNVPIEVIIQQQDNSLQIRCIDKGPGIAPDKLADIFKPFYRADDARSRCSGGHGLGLAICKRAIDLHQGQVKAENAQPKGLCITLSLPYGAVK